MHTIEHLNFNVERTNYLLASQSEYEFSRWISESVLLKINEILDVSAQKAIDGQVYKMRNNNENHPHMEAVDIVIDSLDIELGNINQDRFCRNYISRFSNEFQAKVEPLIEEKVKLYYAALEVNKTRAFTKNSRNNKILSKSDAIFLNIDGLINNALNRRNIGELLKQWSELVSKAEESVREIIYEKAGKAVFRKVIAQEFPEALQNKLFKLLEPGSYWFIYHLLSNSSIFQRLILVKEKKKHDKQQPEINGDKKDRVFPIPERAIRSSLVEFTLSYIVTERGSQFNKKSYLKSQLRQMAARNNQSYYDLICSLHKRINSVEINADMKSSLMSLIEEEIDITLQLENDYHKSYRLYQEITPLLKNELISQSFSLVQWFKRVDSFYPILKIRFFKEISRDHNYLKNVMSGLSQEDRLFLVTQCVDYFTRPALTEQKLLVSTILQTADKLPDNRSFCYLTVSAISGGRIIDIESFRDTTIPFSSITENITTTVEKHESHHSFSLADIDKRIVRWLTTHRTFDDENKQEILRVINYLIRDASCLACQLLTKLFEANNLMELIIDDLEETTLHKVCCLCYSDSYKDYQGCADIIRFAMLAPEFQLKLDNVNRAYWLSLFDFMKKMCRLNRAYSWRHLLSAEKYLDCLITQIATYSKLSTEEIKKCFLQSIINFRRDTLNKNIKATSGLQFIENMKLISVQPDKEELNQNTENERLFAESVFSCDETEKQFSYTLNKFVRFLSGTDSIINEAEWLLLVKSCPRQLEFVIREYGKKSNVRKKLACQLSERIQLSIIQLLAPNESLYISDVFRLSDIYLCTLKNREKATGSQVLQKSTVNSRLTEFTLTYLLVERGSRFNKRSYLRSLLRQMSSRHNLNYLSLLKSMRELLDSSTINSDIKDELRQILGEEVDDGKQQVKNNLRKSCTKNDRLTLNRHSSDTSGYWLYARLWKMVLKSANKADRFSYLVNLLDKRHPILLVRFFRELQLDRSSQSRLLSILCSACLSLCVKKFMLIVGYITDDSSRVYFQTMEKYSLKSGDSKKYYQSLLSCLFNGYPVSLVDPSITQRSDDVSMLDSSGTTPSSSNVIELDKNECNIDNLRRSKAENSNISKINSLEAACGYSNKDLIATQLQKLMKDRRLMAEVVRNHEGLLVRLLMSLSEVRYKNIESLSSVLRMASLSPCFGLSRCGLSELYWCCLIQYVCAHNSDYSPDYFVQIYLCYLQNATAIKLNTLKTILCQQLASGYYTEEKNLLTKLISIIDSQSRYDLRLISCSEEKSNVEEVTAVTSFEEIPAIDAVLADKMTDELSKLQSILVNDAGLILLSPFLPLLFNKSNLLGNGKFKSYSARCYAASMLSYVINSDNSKETENNVMNLNVVDNEFCGLSRLLTGLKINDSHFIPQQLNQSDKALVSGLLKEIIQQWKALGNTSDEGLRETFIRRSGELNYSSKTGWNLNVAQSSFDVLLDRIPWNISLVKHSFMTDVIHVKWRSREYL